MIDRLRRDPGLLLVLIATALVIVLYAPVIGTGIVGYDDSWLVAENWVVQHPSWSSMSTIFFDLDSPRRFVLAPEYLPVRDLSVMLDFAIWGHHYAGHHLTNLVLYVGAIWVWFAALTGLGLDRRVVGIAMLVWALHPSHAESVAWLAERKGVLAMVLAGVTALGYARFRGGRGVAWLVLAALAATCAVWSKAHAAFAIGALAPLELLLPRVSLRRALVGLATIGIAAGLAFVPVLIVANTANVVGTHVVAPAGRFAMVVGVHGFYVQSAVMARANAVSYPISTHGPSILELVLGAVALVAVIGVLAWRRGPVELRAGAVIWVAGWLPVSHLILPLQMIFVADRYLLIPSLGFALAVAAGLDRLPRRKWLVVGALAVAASIRTLDARTNWSDAELLWSRAVESNPDDGMAWSMYAQAVSERGRPDLALEIVHEGLAHVKHPRLQMRQALLLVQGGDRVAGIAAMREAAEGGEGRAMSNLALLLLDDHDTQNALVWAKRGTDAMPMYGPAYMTYGKVALAAQRPQDALVAFRHAFELAPDDCTNRYNLALAELEAKDLAAAREHAQSCVADPRLGRRVQALLDELARRAK